MQSLPFRYKGIAGNRNNCKSYLTISGVYVITYIEQIENNMKASGGAYRCFPVFLFDVLLSEGKRGRIHDEKRLL